MNNTRTPKQNDRCQRTVAEFIKLLTEVSKRGFHGTASITVSLQDGHIQHARVNTDRMIR